MKQKANEGKVQNSALELNSIDLQSKLIPLRDEMVLLDSVVANVYGVETRPENREILFKSEVIERNDPEVKNISSGSIIVFHDNIKALENQRYALEKTLQVYSEKGYQFKPLPDGYNNLGYINPKTKMIVYNNN